MTSEARRWEALGSLIRAERRRLGLRLIDLAGGSQSKWSRIETGKRPPTFADAQYLAQRLQSQQILESFIEASRIDGVRVRGPQDIELVGIDHRHDVLELNASVEVRDDGADIVERRLIRSNIDRLDRLTQRAGLYQHRGVTPTYELEALDGCTIASPVVELTPNYLLAPLTLSRTLGRGETTEFRIQWHLSAMPPRYTFSPLVPSQRFSVRLTFRTHKPPLAVYCFDGMVSTVNSVSIAETLGLPSVELDNDRSVFGEFTAMQHGLAYGYVWRMEKGDDYS